MSAPIGQRASVGFFQTCYNLRKSYHQKIGFKPMIAVSVIGGVILAKNFYDDEKEFGVFERRRYTSYERISNGLFGGFLGGVLSASILTVAPEILIGGVVLGVLGMTEMAVWNYNNPPPGQNPKGSLCQGRVYSSCN